MIKNIKKEDLEILSYAEMAEMILHEVKKPLNTAMIFKEICDLLEYDETEYSNKIGDFYTALSTDKRFVFLKSNEWELRVKHPVDISLDEEDDEDEEEQPEEENEIEEENEENEETDVNEDEIDDDLGNLSVLTEDELEED